MTPQNPRLLIRLPDGSLTEGVAAGWLGAGVMLVEVGRMPKGWQQVTSPSEGASSLVAQETGGSRPTKLPGRTAERAEPL